MADVPHLLKYDEVEATLKASRSTVERLVAAGELDTIRIGASRRILADSVTAFVERHREPSQARP